MVDGGFWRLLKLCIADVRNITGDDQVTLPTYCKAFKIYVYKIAWSLSKFIFLLPDTTILTLLRNVFFLLAHATAFILTYKK